MQNWLKAFLIFGGLGFGCQLAQAEDLGKCDPSHYVSEKSVLDEYSAQIKGRIFRSNGEQELVVHVFPRPPLIFKSCSLSEEYPFDPGWRVREFYPFNDRVFLFQGYENGSSTKAKLINLRTGHQSDLVTKPEFSPDRLFFSTVAGIPSISPPPSGRGALEVWSCTGSVEECKMIYKFPEVETQADVIQGLGPRPTPSISGVVATPTPVVQTQEQRPWKASKVIDSEPLKASEPLNGRRLVSLLSEWSESHRLSFRAIFKTTLNGKFEFLRDEYSCDCDVDKCNCQKKGNSIAVGECPSTLPDVEWRECGYCLAACLKSGVSQCRWGLETISQGTQKNIAAEASTNQEYQCSLESKIAGAAKFEADFQNRKAREAAEEKARESERIAEVKAREAAIIAVEKAAKEQELAQKKAEEEKRKEKAIQYSKYLETKPDWYVKELKLLSKTRGRVFRRNSGQELVIRVPGKNELTFESKLCEMPGEQGLDVSVVEYFSKSNQILVEIVNSDCDAEVSTSYQLIGLDTGKVEKLLGEDETLSVSPYRNYFAAFARVWGRFGNAHSVAVWSCGSAGKPCKEVLRKKDSDIGHTWALSWVGSHSFDLNFHRDVDNKKVSEFTCSCTPQACECKSKSPK